MKIKRLIQTIILAGILLIFLLTTNPSKISLPLILIPYLLIALILYRLTLLALQVLFVGSANNSKSRLYALIITVVITNFALLKSIGQLTLQDGLISAAIIVVSIVYISKFSLSN